MAALHTSEKCSQPDSVAALFHRWAPCPRLWSAIFRMAS